MAYVIWFAHVKVCRTLQEQIFALNCRRDGVTDKNGSCKLLSSDNVRDKFDRSLCYLSHSVSPSTPYAMLV